MKKVRTLPNGSIVSQQKDSEIFKLGVESRVMPGYNVLVINPLCYPGEDSTQREDI